MNLIVHPLTQLAHRANGSGFISFLAMLLPGRPLMTVICFSSVLFWSKKRRKSWSSLTVVLVSHAPESKSTTPSIVSRLLCNVILSGLPNGV